MAPIFQPHPLFKPMFSLVHLRVVCLCKLRSRICRDNFTDIFPDKFFNPRTRLVHAEQKRVPIIAEFLEGVLDGRGKKAGMSQQIFITKY